MSRAAGTVGRLLRVEWAKLGSIRSTWLIVLAAVVSTLAFGLIVCSSVDTGGGSPGCVPGAAGCGDEDVVIDSLGGAYIGQIAFVALGVVAITTEFATGAILTTFLAEPTRRRAVIARAAVIGAVAFAAGLVAALGSFVAGQAILHGNGFVPENGYPIVRLTDLPVVRAIVGTAVYLAAIALLGLGVGAILRRSGAAIATVLTLLYLPLIVSLMLPEAIRGAVQTVSPMMAGLAVQVTVARADSVPIGPWAGLMVAAAWAVGALALATWFIRRDP
jgi:ABC-2 type transport system permease protein